MFGVFCKKKIDADKLVMKLVHDGGPDSSEVIFFHGANSSGEKAFTNKKKVLWIKDLLPQELNDGVVTIRCYTFRNDLFRSSSNAPNYGIEVQAKVLFDEIIARKAVPKSFVLVGHSYGGLLIKQFLLLLADRQHELLHRLKGVVFYGTPHRGAISWQCQWLCYLLPCPTDSFRILEIDHPDLKELHDKFMELKKELNFGAFSFFEDDKFHGMLVVSKWSAVHDHDDYKTNMRVVGHDHKNMCKHTANDDSTFVKLVEVLKEMLQIDLPETIGDGAKLDSSPVPSIESCSFSPTTGSVKTPERGSTDSYNSALKSSTMEHLDPTAGTPIEKYESPAASRANAETPAAVYTPTDQRDSSKTASTVHIGGERRECSFSYAGPIRKNLDGAFKSVSAPSSATNTKTGELSEYDGGESKSSEHTEVDDTDALSVGMNEGEWV